MHFHGRQHGFPEQMK